MDSMKMPEDLVLRLATANDVQLLWEWANDPLVRANSFQPQRIPWDIHREWFAARLASPDCRIWILEDQREPVAQIRYERVDGNGARISYSVAERARGRGLGVAVLEKSFRLAVQCLAVYWVTGVTFAENAASRQAFLRAGFEMVDEPVVDGRSCQVFRRYWRNSKGDGCGPCH